MSMSKNFSYRGYAFTVVVVFNIKIEKRLGGKRWHRLMIKTVDAGGDGFIESRYVEDSDLNEEITIVTNLAKDWVKTKLDGRMPEDKRLIDLGFKND